MNRFPQVDVTDYLRSIRTGWLRVCLLCAAVFPGISPLCLAAEIDIIPAEIKLNGIGAGTQIIVATREDNRDICLTKESKFRLAGPAVATVDSRGFVTPLKDGQAELIVVVRGVEKKIPIHVAGMDPSGLVDFEYDIQPIFSKQSCNSGACHGKQRGQNGFQLSLLGFDSNFDYDALTKEARGRRVFSANPKASLILLKPCGDIAHGGGIKIEKNSAAFVLLERWLVQGAQRQVEGKPKIQSVAAFPSELILQRESEFPLRVVATYSDGTQRDVTRWASFQSNESAIARVNGQGLVHAGSLLGDCAIMARYQGQIAVTSVVVPHPDPIDGSAYKSLPVTNYIDEIVWGRLRRLGITPSAPAEEHTVMRRLYLDLIGRGPTAEEARKYLADTTPGRRARLIDALLEDPEYAENAASKWADLLRPNPYHVGIKTTFNYDYWIRQAFRNNIPYDQFVRELLTAQGSTFHNGVVTMFRDRRTPEDLTTLVSQIFLGTRLECAKCHQHPFEVYSQDDFYSFAAFFARIGRKGTGISAPISGSEEFVFVSENGSVKHPLTGEVLKPRPLRATEAVATDGQDPREVLANWLTADSNPYFARTIANRTWADLMGRGLVEPVDDIRPTNPPSNPMLLDALADSVRKHRYDLKALIREIANSQVYALSSIPNERNGADQRNFSRHLRTRLRAEVLDDSLLNVTGVAENFPAMPANSRSKEAWTVRIPSEFLDSFGRQDPNQDPPCERNTEPTIVQALHLMNSNVLMNRIGAEAGRAVSLSKSELSNEQVIEELYLSIYGRFPKSDETKVCLETFPAEKGSRRGAVEDLMWALLNTPEFVFED